MMGSVLIYVAITKTSLAFVYTTITTPSTTHQEKKELCCISIITE